MSAQSTRRHFLRTSVAASAAVGAGEWAGLLPLSPASADEAKVTPDLVRFSPDIEPIVRLIEETPRDKCVPVIIEQLRAGLPYRHFLAAQYLAAIRAARFHAGRAQGYSHNAFVVHSIHQPAHHPRPKTLKLIVDRDPSSGGLPMRRNQLFLLLSFSLLAAVTALADEPKQERTLIAKPEAFQTLIGPDCSHCRVEANRRKDELRADDRVVCWMQVATDGYINDGAVPIRFFLSKYRVLHDGWGVWVYDPDAGFARGFAPTGGPFSFHGWRNGVMVMKGKDGTLYSGLTGIAFEGPKKGNRLEPRPTLVSDWGFWQDRYPQAVAYFMYDKYMPVELPTEVHQDSFKSRSTADSRLPADTPVLGVWDGKNARAYPLDVLEKAGVIHDMAKGEARVVLWYGPTRTAAAYRQPWGTSGLAGDVGWIFSVDRQVEAAPFVDKRTGLHWDITGRPIEGGPRLIWVDSVQVKWFAWAAEYPETSIYGR